MIKYNEIAVRNLVPFVIFILGFSSCKAQVNKDKVTNWNSYPIPSNQDSLRKYNYSQDEWSVIANQSGVSITKANAITNKSELPFKIIPTSKEKSYFFGKMSLLRVDDGYLIGFFRGEWGGCLYWFSSDGKSQYKISDDEIIQFIQRDGVNYAIEGLDHLSISTGSIIEIVKERGKWMAKTYLKLPNAPYAITSDHANNFYIITSENLLKIDKDAGIKVLVAHGVWSYGLYPNSMVVYNGLLYAGMREGVYKYDLLNDKQEWLLNY